MVKNILRLLVLVLLNLLVILNSDDLRVDQLLNDLNLLTNIQDHDLFSIYLFISFSVTILTLIMIYFLKPFIEVYLMYYLRFSFYFLINLVSISTIYIVLRIIGYSRLYLLMYLLFSSFFLYISDKKFKLIK